MKRNAINEIMAEPIRLPGFPQPIVTRDFAYNWLKSVGYNPSERGFGGLDYLVFGKPTVDEPLTPNAERDAICAELMPLYKGNVN